MQMKNHVQTNVVFSTPADTLQGDGAIDVDVRDLGDWDAVLKLGIVLVVGHDLNT